MEDSITIKVDPPFGRLRLDRPDKRNALNRAMWAAIPDLVRCLAEDVRVKIVLVAGADSRAFAAGADIEEFGLFADDPALAAAFVDDMAAATRALAGLVKPTIAVIRGPCVGGGCGIALCCDFRFADSTATFGVTPSRLGVTYPLEDTKRLIDAVGVAAARDMLMAGQLMDAERALAIGLIDRVFPPEALADEADAYASALAARSQYSVRAMKATIAEIQSGATAETKRSRQAFIDSFGGEDLAEGRRAFLEKRPPRFTVS